MARPRSHRDRRQRRTTAMATAMVVASLTVLLPLLLLLLSRTVVVVRGDYSNTILYPVSEEARAERAAKTSAGATDSAATATAAANAAAGTRQPGAPSRYLEYEGPDATYNIRVGSHPTISYPDLDDFPDTEIRIRFQFGRSPSRQKKIEIDDCPRHFLWLSDRAVQKEFDHRMKTGRWSERVLVEKAYFTLFYGGTGLASRYMDSVDDFQTDLVGWEIMNRSSNHCDWEGIECDETITSVATRTPSDRNDQSRRLGAVVGFQINGFSLEGTLPDDLRHLSSLKRLDLHGNRIQGSIPPSWGSLGRLTDLNLEDNRLTGTLPPKLEGWTSLRNVRLSRNRLEGTLPAGLLEAWTKSYSLDNYPDVPAGNGGGSKSNNNNGRGKKPDRKKVRTGRSFPGGLESLGLSQNRFTGSFPMEVLVRHAKDLASLDLSDNRFTGVLPDEVVPVDPPDELVLKWNDRFGTREFPIGECLDVRDETEITEDMLMENAECIRQVIMDDPHFVNRGSSPQQHRLTIPRVPAASVPAYAGLGKLSRLDLSDNLLRGTLPRAWMDLPALATVLLARNDLSGSLPDELRNLTSLSRLDLSHNRLTGSIPSGASWSDLSKLHYMRLDHNQLSGTIPREFFEGLGWSLKELDMGENRLEGSLPSSIRHMTELEELDLHGNRLTGRLPPEMNRMHPDVRLNLTDNFFTGTVPKLFCGRGAMSSNLLFRQFGCDAVLCPAGTFHPDGAASLYAGCRPCPIERGDTPLSAAILGRRRCGEDNNRTTFVHGDLNGDGVLSEREVLRLLYAYTVGGNWGLQFESWGETTVGQCDLNGVICVDGKVAKIDLTDAFLCVNSERKAAAAHDCKGIPAEISRLTHLEILTLNRRQYLRGTLPTEIGELTRMKYLDISSCPMMTGPLPSEIGRLTNLKVLNIGGCRFNGTIPEELFELSKMEKLHLNMNAFTGSVPSSLEKMTNLKELLLSRTYVNGTIPEAIGGLVALENFEMYGNQLVGVIPESLGRCTNLKRIDLFNNQLTGTIPETLTDIRALQILHIKLNHLTGTISSGFGRLPNLSWFDVSTNHLHGTIPESFGYSKTLKDFRLGGGNMIHNPVPKSLCSNTNINGGLTKAYGCSGVICPLGTYSDPGHATHSDGCKKCPDGRTTTYLGSSRCVELTDEEILAMFYDVMAASNTFPIQEKHWARNRDGPICTWNGVECDENDEIETIWFPLMELNNKDA